ncbi:MAG: class I SAM-dependent methyltransferase [Phenylobacterium sp.]|nr:class I SAM-dependent methyltransferase [Phenylobacterium sp.]
MPDPLRLVRKVGARLRSALAPVSQLDLKAINVRYVETVKAGLPHASAMERAIGGHFDTVGPIEAALLAHYGLPRSGHVVDVGCGAGRLAKPLSAWLDGTYLGVDLVPDLVAHARSISARPDWRFEVIDHIGIPEADGRADMVCFFSVLTHLLHEQSFWYLEEARRVLKPGGRIVFSFLELREPAHLRVFRDTVEHAKKRTEMPLNVFLDRETLAIFAQELGLEVVDIRGGSEPIVAQGALGQALCVFEKP